MFTTARPVPLAPTHKSKLHRLRWESSGQFIGSSYRLAPYTKKYSYNQSVDINTLSKLEYKPNERDTFRLTAGLNQSLMSVPLPQLSAAVGVKQKQTDMQNFIIAAFRRTGGRFYDEANIALTNAFYRETFASRGTIFDPLPVVERRRTANQQRSTDCISASTMCFRLKEI